MFDIINLSVLAIFVPTFFFVSITPGMCMTLSMAMGISIGVKRTLWMMWGELIGVAIIVVASLLGVAAIMLKYPQFFTAFKYIGGCYLLFLGIQLFRSQGKMAISASQSKFDVPKFSLALNGFITAIANPKGWAFFIALLPPFINNAKPLIPQTLIMLTIILLIEFLCLIAYASGGKTLRVFLQKSNNVNFLNYIAGTLMVLVAIWLAFG